MEKNKIFIECKCSNHLLQVINDVEYYNDNKQIHQEFWLAMFTYGTYHKKPNFWNRLGIIYNFLKTGKMHEDQVILNPDEARKLADFLNNNIVPTKK